VSFYLKQYRERIVPTIKSKKQVRNRRYNSIDTLVREGFFSDEAMRERNPLLHHQLIGQFETEEDLRAKQTCATFSAFLFQSMDNKRTTKRFLQQVENQTIVDEEDESSEDLIEEDEVNFTKDEQERRENGEEDEGPKISPEELEQNREYFLYTMKLRFVNGDDSEFFNYSTVDLNADLDYEQSNIDAQESYFDSEAPSKSLGKGQISQDTQVVDY